MLARFPAGSTTWAMLLGEQVILSQARLRLPSGMTPAYGEGIWVISAAGNIVLLPISTMREKSLELRIRVRRLYRWFGLQRVGCGASRSWRATAAAKRPPSTSTGMSWDILPVRTVSEHSCGRARGVCAIWAFCKAAIIAELTL